MRLINTLYNAYHPSVCFSGEWLHVVWYDERDGNDEIYCKNKYIESTPANQFSYLPRGLDLGTVQIDKYSLDSLHIYNYGLNSLSIDSIFTESPFSLSLDKSTWSDLIENIDIPFGEKLIYAKISAILPGYFADSISIVIGDSLYTIKIEGTCKESSGFIGESGFLATSLYPNPVGHEARITFNHENRSDIIIEVYDSKGNRVDHLKLENQLPGIKTITWKRNNLPSGLYFYTLKDGKRSGSAKMILIDL
jgi:hypothetical protein